MRVPATGAAGQELTYQLCVENRSPAEAHHVLVRNPLPANAQFVRAVPEPSAREPELLWQLGTLSPGAVREITLVLAPTGAGDVKNCARVQFEHGQCVTTQIARPGIQLRKEGPSQAMVNEALTFRLTVTNVGSTELTGVMIKDSLPAGLEHASKNNALSWEVGRLAPGQSSQVEYQVVARQSGRLCNKAAATAAGGIRHEVESCVNVAEAKLGLKMTGPERRYVKTGAAFQITATNPGTAPLSHVTITNPLPPQTTFVSASNNGVLAGTEVKWEFGPLAPGESRTVDLVLRAQTEGEITNRATGAAEYGLAAEAEARIMFVGVSAILLELIEANDPVEVGTETSYTIVIKNQGSTPVTDIRMVAQVPKQMEVVRVTGPSDNKLEGGAIVFASFLLKPAAEARYTVFVKTKTPGEARFKVDLNAAELTSGPIHEEESTTIYTDLPSALRWLKERIYPTRLRGELVRH
jgi:uncharacterized repeat protein (TIGR01451 family)